MNKRINILFLFIISLCFIFITGCSNKINDNDNDNMQLLEGEISLYSEDNKLVYEISETYYVVYYYENDTITGLEFIYKYNDINETKDNFDNIKTSYMDDPNVVKVEMFGRQIKITFNEDQYKKYPLETVREIYAAYKEMIK